MATTKITDLTAYTDPVSTDVLPIVDVSGDLTKKVSIADLMENAGSGTAGAPGISFDGDSNTGIYRPGADQVAISTGGTGRLFIDSSGRLGVGTASPAVALHVATTGTPQFRLEDLDTADAYANLSASNDNFVIQADPQNVSGSTRIGFETDGTEAMRIDSNQIIYTRAAVGETFYASTNTDLRTATGAGTDTGAVGIESLATNTNNRYHISFSNPNGVVGSIRTNASATDFLTSSDYRLKENVTPVTDGIDRLKQLKPSRFNFITDPSVTVDGFLAHEVQDVIPEAISGEKDAVQTWEEGERLPEGVSVGDAKLDENGDPRPAYQGIDQSRLVPLLTAALQEAVTKIETLEARLKAADL